MAECVKCKKQIPDEYPFCPFCGQRMAKKKLPTISNLQYILVCNREAFASAWNSARLLDADEAREWFFAQRSVLVYGFGLEYYFRPSNRRCDETVETRKFVDDKYIKSTLPGPTHNDMYAYKSAYPVEGYLKAAELRLVGKELFLTKEECVAALNAIIEEAGYHVDV